jgi:putative glutathione S-transferase
VEVVSAPVGPRLYGDGKLLSDDWWEIPAALAGLTRDPAGLYVDGVAVDAVADQLWIDVVEGLEQAIFSSTPTAREAALRVFYARLGLIELRLATAPYLVGEGLTLADLILFGVVLGFDHGYRSRLGWGPAAIIDYPHLWRWAREIFSLPGLIQPADLIAVGLAPDARGVRRAVWGEPIPVEGVTDSLAAWREPVS